MQQTVRNETKQEEPRSGMLDRSLCSVCLTLSQLHECVCHFHLLDFSRRIDGSHDLRLDLLVDRFLPGRQRALDDVLSLRGKLTRNVH